MKEVGLQHEDERVHRAVIGCVAALGCKRLRSAAMDARQMGREPLPSHELQALLSRRLHRGSEIRTLSKRQMSCEVGRA